MADLISSTLKYPDGEPVECVISPSTIGRVPEAAASHELFKKSNVCATITVTPCWCYGSETMDMSPDIPHAIWGFNGTERPGAVYLAAVLASHAQKGFQPLGFMVEMFRKLMIQIFQKMSKKTFTLCACSSCNWLDERHCLPING